MKNSPYHIFFNNLANPLRIKIISSLKIKSKTVTELVKELKVEQSKISHALKNLWTCNLVDFKQRGKERIYSLNKKTLVPILKLIDQHSKVNCNGRCKFCLHNKK